LNLKFSGLENAENGPWYLKTLEKSGKWDVVDLDGGLMGDRLDVVMGLIGFEDPADPTFYGSTRGGACQESLTSRLWGC